MSTLTNSKSPSHHDEIIEDSQNTLKPMGNGEHEEYYSLSLIDISVFLLNRGSRKSTITKYFSRNHLEPEQLSRQACLARLVYSDRESNLQMVLIYTIFSILFQPVANLLIQPLRSTDYIPIEEHMNLIAMGYDHTIIDLWNWNEFGELSGVHHTQTSQPGIASFHFDLKPLNIPIFLPATNNLTQHLRTITTGYDPTGEHMNRIAKGYDHTTIDLRNLIEALGVICHTQTSQPDRASFNIDVKAHNILIGGGKWVITDWGQGHHKIARESGISEATKRHRADEYSPPETKVDQSYDVLAIELIALEILEWMKCGNAGVMLFHNECKHAEPEKIKALAYNSHCGKDVDKLQSTVKKVLVEGKIIDNLDNIDNKPSPVQGSQSRDLLQFNLKSHPHLVFHDGVLSPAPRDFSTKSTSPIPEILLLYGRNYNTKTKDNDRWRTSEEPGYHGRKDTGSEMLLGLCWGFGLLILPAYRGYRKDCHMDHAIQNKFGTWMHLALVLSFSFAHNSSLIGMGYNLLGKGNKRESRRLKNGAVALMVPILMLLVGFLGYGVGSEVLMVAVLPQCLSLWISLVWIWTGRCNEKRNDSCAVDQKA